MVNYVKPFVEYLGEPGDRLYLRFDAATRKKIAEHRKHAQIVTAYLADETVDRKQLYLALGTLLSEQPRLSLYLPFELLIHAPSYFVADYLEAWRECWAYRDAREAFNLGDVYERKCSDGEPEKIVKAMHLAGHLLKYGYLKSNDIETIMFAMRSDPLLCYSLSDVLPFMQEKQLLETADLQKIRDYLTTLPPRQLPPKLLTETAARTEWLRDKAQSYGIKGDFKLQNPTGPFSKNLELEYGDKYFEISPDESLLICGSRLKGYGRDNSDYDFLHFDATTGQIREFVGIPHEFEIAAPSILCAAWYGTDVNKTDEQQFQAAARYLNLDAEQRESCLLRLESYLLQFRLMHKGFPCAYPDCAATTKRYGDIDGTSAFYDDRYRRIATELFVKYVWLP